jgi:hypothetical protein
MTTYTPPAASVNAYREVCACCDATVIEIAGCGPSPDVDEIRTVCLTCHGGRLELPRIEGSQVVDLREAIGARAARGQRGPFHVTFPAGRPQD